MSSSLGQRENSFDMTGKDHCDLHNNHAKPITKVQPQVPTSDGLENVFSRHASDTLSKEHANGISNCSARSCDDNVNVSSGQTANSNNMDNCSGICVNEHANTIVGNGHVVANGHVNGHDVTNGFGNGHVVSNGNDNGHGVDNRQVVYGHGVVDGYGNNLVVVNGLGTGIGGSSRSSYSNLSEVSIAENYEPVFRNFQIENDSMETR
jgi:hypothetical protein